MGILVLVNNSSVLEFDVEVLPYWSAEWSILQITRPFACPDNLPYIYLNIILQN